MPATVDQMFVISARTEGKAHHDRNFAVIGETLKPIQKTSDTIVVTCDSIGTTGGWTFATFGTIAVAIRPADSCANAPTSGRMMVLSVPILQQDGQSLPVLFFRGRLSVRLPA